MQTSAFPSIDEENNCGDFNIFIHIYRQLLQCSCKIIKDSIHQTEQNPLDDFCFMYSFFPNTCINLTSRRMMKRKKKLPGSGQMRKYALNKYVWEEKPVLSLSKSPLIESLILESCLAKYKVHKSAVDGHQPCHLWSTTFVCML